MAVTAGNSGQSMTTDSAGAGLHSTSVVVDSHNDLLMGVAARPAREWAGYFAESWIPQLRAGGVNVQVLPVWVDAAAQPEHALREILRMIEAAHRLSEELPAEAGLCLSAGDIDRVVNSGRLALVLAMEGLPDTGRDGELVSQLYRLGIRMASLTHYGRTPLADGSAEDATGSRLTTQGMRAIAEMERLGIIVDISHLGASGVGHVLEIARRPVVASHSCARALCDHHRNLSDEHLRGIAATGGVICVNFYGSFVHPSDNSVDRLLDQIEHIATVAGPDAVGLGPDYMRQLGVELLPPWQWEQDADGAAPRFIDGQDQPGGLPEITAGLQRRGWSDERIRGVLGENMMRVFRAVLAG